MKTEFFLPMDPPTITHQEKKVHVIHGKPIFYEPDDLKYARQKLMAYLGQYIPERPYYSRVRLTVLWFFKETGKHKDGTYRDTKPDLDNLMKLLQDCMTQLHFWDDDALIVGLMTEKRWSSQPGILIRIEDEFV